MAKHENYDYSHPECPDRVTSIHAHLNKKVNHSVWDKFDIETFPIF